MSESLRALNRREPQILTAVAAGRGELLCGCEPDLTIDGRWCDYVAVHRLFNAGFICGVRAGPVGPQAP